MKVFSKPISSPGRTEKFPPPLMRFLRSNVGSRSRGRSRSSPMFLRKKNNAVIETQEPTSPKVTCIGQVRVRRSSKTSNSSRRKAPAKNHHCWCFQKTQFFHQFPHKLKPRSFRQVLRKCVSFFRFGYCKKVEIRDDSSKMDSNQSGKHKETDTEDEDEESEVKVSDVDFVSSSPPKNALILTRCRSAPYRSSSLANLFWGSRLSTVETGDEIDKQKALQQQEEREQERPTSDTDHNFRDSTSESRMDQQNLGISQEFEGSINGRTEEINVFESSAKPLTLTRCKSEPARTGERLNPRASLERLDFAESCSSHACESVIN